MFESTGSLLESSMPVGPIEPATKRGLSGVEYLSHAARASRAAATFSSRVFSSMPHSRRRCGVDWKVHVSTTSQPTARNDSWIDWMMSGRVSTRLSLHPSSDLPPKSSARRVMALDVRAHRAVVDEHAVGERGEVRRWETAANRRESDMQVDQTEKDARNASARAGALAECLTWPQFA